MDSAGRKPPTSATLFCSPPACSSKRLISCLNTQKTQGSDRSHSEGSERTQGCFNHFKITASLKCTLIINHVLVFLLLRARGVRKHGFQSKRTNLMEWPPESFQITCKHAHHNLCTKNAGHAPAVCYEPRQLFLTWRCLL